MAFYRSITVLACIAFCTALASGQVILNGAYTTTAPSSSCVPGPRNSSFVTTDLKAWLYVSVSNAAVGDTLEADFIRPDGTLFNTQSFIPVTQAGDHCFDGFLVIGGTNAANTGSLPSVRRQRSWRPAAETLIA